MDSYIEVSWYLQDRVILAKPTPVLTKEVLENFSHEIQPYFAQGNALFIHVIWDCTQIKKIPSLSDINQALLPYYHRRLGWSMGVGGNPIVVMSAAVLLQIFGKRLRVVKSFEEALAFLNYVDVTLPMLQAVDTLTSR